MIGPIARMSMWPREENKFKPFDSASENELKRMAVSKFYFYFPKTSEIAPN